MFDYKVVRANLEVLHQATCPLPGYFGAQAEEFTRVGEYGLALDTIASAWLRGKAAMPAGLFRVLEGLAKNMELDSDPEYEAAAQLRALQARLQQP